MLSQEITWGAGHLPSSPPRPCRRRILVMVGLNREDVSGQSTDHTMRPYVMLLCVLDSAVTRWRPGLLSGLSSDCPCDDYRAVSSV